MRIKTLNLMRFIFISFLMFLFSLHSAYALYLDSRVFTLESEKSFYSRQFVNNTKNTNLYTIDAWRIDRPGKNEIRKELQEGELMYTPLRKIMQSDGREFFKLFYSGPKDDQERYYRIVIHEIPVALHSPGGVNKTPLVSPIVALETIMVVRPRELHFDYQYNSQARILKNTGNTYFQVMIHRSCEARDDTAKVFYLLPGESYHGSDLDGEHRKFIVGFNRYQQFGKQCLN
ncbi:hypothetical protein [Klebsiella aerogenes]|uniref:hypothetical protein n=1 Tax=Klebsiella aerogenes TaxID=548 RepID=UPI0028124DEF|nr:hypothetical protein [Klebsiella aerogenes]